MSPDPISFTGTDRFSVHRRLGSGSFGIVYDCFDRKRSSRVALKLLKDQTTLLQFKNEFRALADLQHTNLVKLYELSSDGDQWFLIMELIEGVNLLEYVGVRTARNPKLVPISGDTPTVSMIRDIDTTLSSGASSAQAHTSGTFHEKRLRDSMVQLAEGVAALHSAGMLHRDVKPSNVLVTNDGRVVLLDFGLVKEIDVDSEEATLRVVGTPAYMSPEQAMGKPASEASDWYAVGVMLYEALTGTVPFRGTRAEMLVRKRNAEPPPPGELIPGLPPDLDALCRDLLHARPEQRPASADILARLRERSSMIAPRSAGSRRGARAPFVGRQEQMAALLDAFRVLQEGRAVTVLVHGNSGMGKTTLVRRFLDNVRRSEPQALVLAGRCYEQESVPYKGFDSLMDVLCQHLQTLSDVGLERFLPRDILTLARIFPMLLQVPGVSEGRRPAQIYDSQELRRRGFSAFRELVARIADQRPLVLFIDDLQWGDPDSAALLAELLRPPDPPPLLFIGCFRSEYRNDPVVRAMLNFRNIGTTDLDIRELAVGELEAGPARELALALAGTDNTMTLERAEAIGREAGGSPIFIAELVRSPAGNRSQQFSLEATIYARVMQLPDAARRILEVLSVAGHPMLWVACGEAAGVHPEVRTGALDALRAERLVRAHRTGDRDEFEVYHARIADSVVSRLAEQDSRDCHRRVAQALEKVGADPETLYVHSRAAGQSEAAARYAAVAANQALEALAFNRAARLYNAALELGGRDEIWSRQLWLKLGDALRHAGRGDESAQAYLTAASSGDRHESIELQRRAAEQLLRSGHIDRGLAIVRSILEVLRMRMPKTPRTALVWLVLYRLRARLRGLGFRERSAATIPAEDLLRLDTCWSAAVGLGMVDTIRGAYFQVRYLLLALRTGEPLRVARALALEISFSANAGGAARERTERLSQKTLALAQRINDPQTIGLAQVTTGIAMYLEGRWRESLECCERSEEYLREHYTGFAPEIDSAHHFQLRSLYQLGELKELARRLPALLKDAEERGDLYGATMLSVRNLYMLRLTADLAARARQENREAIDRWSQQGFHNQHYVYLIAQTEMDLYLGEGGVAWRRITETWKTLTRSLLLRVQFARLEATHLRARCALAANAENKAAGLLKEAEKAAAVMERVNMPWSNPLARTIRAGIMAASGERKAALRLLRDAEGELTAQEMKLYAAAVKRRRGELTGGEEGQRLILPADEEMAQQQIINPSRMTAMLLPGNFGGD